MKQYSNLRLCVFGHQMENCTVKMVISSLNFSVPKKSHILVCGEIYTDTDLES